MHFQILQHSQHFLWISWRNISHPSCLSEPFLLPKLHSLSTEVLKLWNSSFRTSSCISKANRVVLFSQFSLYRILHGVKSVISVAIYKAYLKFRRSHTACEEKCIQLVKVKGPVMASHENGNERTRNSGKNWKELLHEWPFTANQFVWASSLLWLINRLPFLSQATGHIENDASNSSSNFACAFVATVIYLPSRCLGTMGDRGDMFLRKVSGLSTDYTRCITEGRALHNHRYHNLKSYKNTGACFLALL